MTISPGQYDITIYQGTTFSQQLTWKDQNGTPINLTGYSARLMARSSIDAATPFISLSNDNGGIALGGAAGYHHPEHDGHADLGANGKRRRL